jgi:hypothetical protein
LLWGLDGEILIASSFGELGEGPQMSRGGLLEALKFRSFQVN